MLFQDVDRQAVIVLAEQSLEITRQQVDFDIDDRAGPVAVDNRLFCGVRNDIDVEAPTRYRVDGKADAVDADRAFLCNITRPVRDSLRTPSSGSSGP